MPDVTTNINTLSKGVTDLARDAAYVAVGLGVLGYQRAQVQRVELQNRLSQDLALDQRIDDVRHGVAKGIQQIDDLAESAVHFVETTLQPMEEQLPPTVTQLTAKGPGAGPRGADPDPPTRQRLSATPPDVPTTLALSPPPTRPGRRRASSRAGSSAATRWRRAAAPASPRSTGTSTGRTSSGSVSSVRSARASSRSCAATSDIATSRPEHTL